MQHSVKLVMNRIVAIPRFIDTTAEVQDALATRKPIVALESTIVTHGMPYPDNINTAIQVEEIVRSEVGGN